MYLLFCPLHTQVVTRIQEYAYLIFNYLDMFRLCLPVSSISHSSLDFSSQFVAKYSDSSSDHFTDQEFCLTVGQVDQSDEKGQGFPNPLYLQIQLS